MAPFKPAAESAFSLKKTAGAYLEKLLYQSSVEVFVAGLINGYLIMLLLFLLDYRLGLNTPLALFYMIPVFIITLTAGRLNGVVAAFIAALLELLSSHHTLNIHNLNLSLTWNTANNLVFFLVFALLLAGLKRVMISERFLSRLDPLTGLYNGNYFTNMVTREIERGQRYKHAFTIVYIYCENLDQAAKLLGQKVREEILKTTASQLKRTLRTTDAIAYFGGSDFGVVLPETNADQAAATIQRIKSQLLDCSVENLWPINYRIGVETFTEFSQSSETMLKQAYLQMRRNRAETVTAAKPN